MRTARQRDAVALRDAVLRTGIIGVQCTVSPETLTHTRGRQGVEVGSVFQSERVFIPALVLLHLPTHELDHSCELLDAAQRLDDLRAVPHDLVINVLPVSSDAT